MRNTLTYTSLALVGLGLFVTAFVAHYAGCEGAVLVLTIAIGAPPYVLLALALRRACRTLSFVTVLVAALLTLAFAFEVYFDAFFVNPSSFGGLLLWQVPIAQFLFAALVWLGVFVCDRKRKVTDGTPVT